MQKENQAWIWVGVVAVIVILVVAVVWKPKSATPVTTGPTHAPAGQIVAGFPQQLVLDSNAQVDTSYALNYASTTQYTTQINSSSSVSTTFASYQKYFQSNGWTILNLSQSSPTVQGIYATNATAGVTVTIVAVGQGSQTTISYVKQ
jgi:hypothetical protein